MTDLPAVPSSPARRTRRPAVGAERAFRKPSGVVPWPVVLLAGGPKSETARAAAMASASDRVDRTFWLSWKERTPDALASIAGARFEIVVHDGRLDDFEAAIAAVVGIGRAKGGRPHLLVIDGVSQLWESVKDWGTANAVASSSGSFWYAVNDRWSEFVTVLRKHDGPVLLIGRRDGDAVMGQKDLAADVDVLVEFDDDEKVSATGTRYEPPIRSRWMPDEFTVEGLWDLLNLGSAK